MTSIYAFFLLSNCFINIFLLAGNYCLLCIINQAGNSFEYICIPLMQIDNMRGQMIDYVIVTPGQSTSLTGETLIVDDNYHGIQYSGSGWKPVTNQLFAETSKIGVHSFQNTTMQTSNPGDSLTFSFSGSFKPVCQITRSFSVQVPR